MKILITGITGQDGAWLASKLLSEGHEVYGAVRRGSTPKTGRLDFLKITAQVKLIPLEITEFSNVFRTLSTLKPDQIYNLAAQSFVQDSFAHPILTAQINYLGVQNFLEAIRLTGLDCAFYQASTSEMFGDVLSDPQSETTPFNPMSPYAVSKCAAHHAVVNYRAAYGLRGSTGILFNHESELRGREFVTRKISHQLAEMSVGRQNPIQLGNLSSVRDWGYAKDYVDAMCLMINAKDSDDYVVATNQTISVRQFFEKCARVAGFDPVFDGEGLAEICTDRKSGRILCQVNEAFYRPSDVIYLRGDFSKIRTNLGWKPTTSVDELAEVMTSFDLDVVNGKIKDFGI
jgi:GDPmannose 4,6-dehydratase